MYNLLLLVLGKLSGLGTTYVLGPWRKRQTYTFQDPLELTVPSELGLGGRPHGEQRSEQSPISERHSPSCGDLNTEGLQAGPRSVLDFSQRRGSL